MGARTNFELQDGRGSVWLYSHWGGDSKAADLAAAIKHAEPRWFDTSYAMRMVVSYLIKDSLMEETGYGLSSHEHGEENYEPMSVDFVNGNVTCQGLVYSFPNFVKLFCRSEYYETVGA